MNANIDIKRTICLTALAAALTLPTAYAADNPLTQAQSLAAAGKVKEAYALLAAQEFDHAGDIDFDTLLGTTALDSGHPDKATLAFERVLALDPNRAGVRLDLARAYFALGDLARAKSELDVVSAQNPPQAAQLVIAGYRKAIAEKEQAKLTTVRGYAESFAGYDNNISSVVSDFTGAVLSAYNLPGFQPTGNAVKRGSPIAGIAGGMEVTHTVDDKLALFGGADLRYRGVTGDSNFSSTQLDVRGGLAYQMGADALRAGVFLQDYLQRTDVPSADRNTLGLNVEWRHPLDEKSSVKMFGLAMRQRYADLSVNDINTLAVGAGWLRQFDLHCKPVLQATLLLSQDNALNPLANGSDVSKRSAGAGVYGQMSLNDTLDVFGVFNWTYRSDRTPFARATTIDYGNDRLSELSFGLNWTPAPRWTVRPQITYTENRSNVALSEFRRTEATVTLRRDFQ